VAIPAVSQGDSVRPSCEHLFETRDVRQSAYDQALVRYDELVLLPTFRDFVVLYITEGSKRNRNRISIGNSDEKIVAMAAGWIQRFSTKHLDYSIQYHADQDLEELRQYWAEILAIDGSRIRLQPKSNSGHLNGRSWRSLHGVMTIAVGDTLLRARLQAWIDRVRDDWGLHSAAPHGA
jgi:hypothetical protein